VRAGAPAAATRAAASSAVPRSRVDARSAAPRPPFRRRNETSSSLFRLPPSPPPPPHALPPPPQASPPSPEVVALADRVCALTILEAADLHALLKKRLRLPDAAPAMGAVPMMMAAAPAAPAAGAGADASAGASAPAPPAEKTTFDVVLSGFDPARKIACIKEVRASGNPPLGLKEAKALVEKGGETVAGGLSRPDAEALVAKLEAAGGRAELR